MNRSQHHRFSYSHGIFDRTNGTDHGDVWPGTVDNDIYYGRGGTDTISGFKGNDRLHGGAGIDFLDGEEGNDKLFGDAGDDLLAGGYGNDVSTGGAGADKFYQFTEYSTDTHIDRITDFVAKGKNHELVVFIDNLHFQFADLADIKHHMKQVDDDVRFNFGVHNFLIFEHTHKADFHFNDFQF